MSLLTLDEVCGRPGRAREVEGVREETFGVPGEIIGTYSEPAGGEAVEAWKEPGGESPAGGFWSRRFEGEQTAARLRFDVAFGLVIPVLCFVFDPVVFRDWFSGAGGIYSSFRFYAYALSAAEVATLACWLYYGASAPRLAGLAAGVFYAGAVFSFALAVAILPFSAIGLIFVVGALGFVPFLTAFVYLRQARRAMAVARSVGESGGRTAAWVALGLTFALVAPAAGQRGAARAVAESFAEARAGREMSAPRAFMTRVLADASGATFDEVVREYEKETNPARRARLAKAYAEVTGGSIEARLARLND